MSYDPSVTDRSYLFGCLLAIADKTEQDTYDEDEKYKRETNAKRYWSRFSERPYKTWQIIEERLIPYLNKNGCHKIDYEKFIQEIMNKMSISDFTDSKPLSPEYLIGYHHYLSYMYERNKKKKEENKDGNITERTEGNTAE